MTYDKYIVYMSEQALKMLKLNIAFLAEVNVEAAAKQKKVIMEGIRSYIFDCRKDFKWLNR